MSLTAPVTAEYFSTYSQKALELMNAGNTQDVSDLIWMWSVPSHSRWQCFMRLAHRISSLVISLVVRYTHLFSGGKHVPTSVKDARHFPFELILAQNLCNIQKLSA